MIYTCTCSDKQQDEMYGKNKRVMNPMKKENMYRCTVCKKEHTVYLKEENNGYKNKSRKG